MDIYDQRSVLVGYCPDPKPVKTNRELSSRDARANNRSSLSYVFNAIKSNPEKYGVKKISKSEARVKRDLGTGKIRNIKGLQRAENDSKLPDDVNSVPQSEFGSATQFLCGKDWKECCGVSNRPETGEHIVVEKGTEDTYPANPAFYVFLLNANTKDPLIKYGKTDKFRARLASYTAQVESLRIMHLKIWPLEMKNVLCKHSSAQKERMPDLMSKDAWPEHLLEHLVKLRVRYSIEDRKDRLNVQRLSGKGVHGLDAVLDRKYKSDDYRVKGNFSEFHHYGTRVAQEMERIIRLAETDFAANVPWPVQVKKSPRNHPGDDEHRGSITVSKYPQISGKGRKDAVQA